MGKKTKEKSPANFDLNQTSDESIRKWLYTIIDAELDKEPELRDDDLIYECSMLCAELGGNEEEISDESFHEMISKAKESGAKPIRPRKKKRLTRPLAFITATIVLVSLVVTIASANTNISLSDFFDLSIKKILRMMPGESYEADSITVTKYGKSTNYSYTEEAIKSINADLLFPSYLPRQMTIERIVVSDTGVGNDYSVIFFTGDAPTLSMMATVQEVCNPIGMKSDTTIHQAELFDIYITKIKNNIYQAEFYYRDILYSILYEDKDELIKMVDGMKTVE